MALLLTPLSSKALATSIDTFPRQGYIDSTHVVIYSVPQFQKIYQKILEHKVMSTELDTCKLENGLYIDLIDEYKVSASIDQSIIADKDKIVGAKNNIINNMQHYAVIRAQEIEDLQTELDRTLKKAKTRDIVILSTASVIAVALIVAVILK